MRSNDDLRVISIAIIIALIAGAGAGYMLGNSPIPGYKEEIELFERENLVLNDQLEQLQGELTSIQAQVESLTANLTDTRSSIESLEIELLETKADIEIIQLSYSELEGEYSLLQKVYQDIEDEYFIFQSDNDELQENYDILQATFENLNGSYSDLLSYLEETEKEEIDEDAHVWISPIDATASGYNIWGETWYTGPPLLAIDGIDFTAWTLYDMGEIIFDLGSDKIIRGIEAYWGGHVTNGNTVNVYVDGEQVLSNEQFSASSNIRYFSPIRGRFVKYQTVALPHNKYLQIASCSEIAEFKVFVEES